MLLLYAFLLFASIASADAQDALQAAAMLVQQGRLDDAEQQARLALADAETRAAANSVLGTIRIQQNRLDEGVTFLREAIRLEPRLVGAHLNLAQVHALQRDSAKALDAYDQALSLKPDLLAALRAAGAIAESSGELERSLSYWMRAKKFAPDEAEILLGFGRVCLKMDLLSDAEPALARAAALKPEERSYQYALAAAKVGKRDYEAAQRLLQPLVDKQPQDPHLQYALGSVFYLQGHLADAAARFRESIRLQPEQLASPYYLALTLRDHGNDAEAIEILEGLLRRHRDHASSSEVLGGLLIGAQRYADAERHLRTAIRLNPKSVKANYQLGLLLARMGRKDEADKQLALTKSLREEDAANSRLQLRLLDPGR